LRAWRDWGSLSRRVRSGTGIVVEMGREERRKEGKGGGWEGCLGGECRSFVSLLPGAVFCPLFLGVRSFFLVVFASYSVAPCSFASCSRTYLFCSIPLFAALYSDSGIHYTLYYYHLLPFTFCSTNERTNRDSSHWLIMIQGL